jgi:ABC-type uncharacterized transport system fused permease/ATPase subunit
LTAENGGFRPGQCFARLWEPTDGTVAFSCDEAGICFLPQQPYLPIGTLREVLLYPDEPGPVCRRPATICTETEGPNSPQS